MKFYLAGQTTPQHRSLDGQTNGYSNDLQSTNYKAKSIRFRRRSHVSSPSQPWPEIIEEKRQEYTNTLNQLIEATQKRSITTHKSLLQTFSDVTITTITTRAMEITQDVINLQGFE